MGDSPELEPTNTEADAPVDAPAPAPAPAAMADGPRVQRRETWVDIGDPYAGFQFRLWVNAPVRLWNDVWSGRTNGIIRAALLQIVLEHNGWRDEHGAPYPAASDPAFYDAIPNELFSFVLTVAQEESQRLPNLRALKKRR